MMRTIPQHDIDSLDRLWGGVKRAAVLTHAHPDGDAIGSALGIIRYLREKRGVNCRLVLNDGWPHFLSFLFEDGELRDTVILERDGADRAAEALSEAGMLVCTDFNSLDRAGEGLEALVRRSAAPRVVIDHHLHPDEGSFGLTFSETAISSASELAYCVLKLMPDVAGDASKLPLGTLTALCTGITTDTNNFANSVFPGTLTNYAEMLAAGVDRLHILDCLYNQFSESRVRAMGDILSRRMRVTRGGLAYIVIDESAYRGYGLSSGDTEGLVNIPLTIKDVRMSIFLRQEGDLWRVSIRSKPGVSAYRMAKEHFGGGGHELAAGGRVPVGKGTATAEDMEKYIVRCAEGML